MLQVMCGHEERALLHGSLSRREELQQTADKTTDEVHQGLKITLTSFTM